jgi:hypothetical protein
VPPWQDAVSQSPIRELTVRSTLVGGRRKKIQQRARLLALLFGLVEPSGVVSHHVPHHLPHVPAGILVVAHVVDAVGRQILVGDSKDLGLCTLRLCKRYRLLSARGKHVHQVVVAIARELAAFAWAIARTVPVAS